MNVFFPSFLSTKSKPFRLDCSSYFSTWVPSLRADRDPTPASNHRWAPGGGTRWLSWAGREGWRPRVGGPRQTHWLRKACTVAQRLPGLPCVWTFCLLHGWHENTLDHESQSIELKVLSFVEHLFLSPSKVICCTSCWGFLGPELYLKPLQISACSSIRRRDSNLVLCLIPYFIPCIRHDCAESRASGEEAAPVPDLS